MLKYHEPFIIQLYKKCVAPFGYRKLKRLREKGLPEQFFIPLSFLFPYDPPFGFGYHMQKSYKN